MEDYKAARRVPYGRLGDFIGRRIRFIGRIKEAEEDALILEASEGKCVKCFLRDSPPACRYVEVVATVQEDLTIRQGEHDQTIPLGDNIDIELADAATAATFHPQFSHLFDSE
ncbi:replication factor A protein 3 domain-containing protein, putative [Eimeria necatrix]|uniref:Replication factor A protein 3 domain-containing protein, putative n=1 Tax=Eimeria necatrix TaxID=51315 RepID=U6N4L8_9EIME|nr:replication factor A protein 3 domain-containing protein, putative [Eimeria necatrix]CDJ69650.1 replication factor A protein 3 domain-containing protein, putative [Eimeria necatrix]